MTPPPGRRGSGSASMLALLFVLLGSSGCVSLLPVAVAALGGEGGKAGGAAAGFGPFAGAPSAAQNSRPDSALSDALASVDNQVSAVCKAQLPAAEAEITQGCRTRPVCLAGAQRPMLLRVCAAAGPDLTAGLEPPAAGWQWTGQE